MRKTNLVLMGIALLLATGCNNTTKTDAAASLPRTETPIELADSVSRMLTQAANDSLTIHSIMVVQDNQVIYEKWLNGAAPDSLHILNSVSKTFYIARRRACSGRRQTLSR